MSYSSSQPKPCQNTLSKMTSIHLVYGDAHSDERTTGDHSSEIDADDFDEDDEPIMTQQLLMRLLVMVMMAVITSLLRRQNY